MHQNNIVTTKKPKAVRLSKKLNGYKTYKKIFSPCICGKDFLLGSFDEAVFEY